MHQMIRIFFTKHPRGDRSRSELVWEDVIPRPEYETRRKELDRLFDSIQTDAPAGMGTQVIRKVAKGDKKSGVGSVVFSRNVPWYPGIGNAHRAGVRLARFLERHDGEHNYLFSQHFIFEEGGYHYNYNISFLEYFEDHEEKLRYLERKVAARRGVITRTQNKMNRIRDAYASTLFPEALGDDPKYLALSQSLREKQQRLDVLMTIDAHDLPKCVADADTYLVSKNSQTL